MTQTESVPNEQPIEVPPLASDFPKVSHDQWEVLVAKVMNRGRPEGKQLSPEQSVDRLRIHSLEGVTVEPLYALPDDVEEPPATGAPGVMPFTRGRSAVKETSDWDIRQLHDDPDVAVTKAQILADLERGATSVWIKVGANGVAADKLGEVLDGVMLDLAPVAVSSDDDQGAAAAALKAVWDAKGVAADKVSGSLGIDPFGFAARRGGDIDTSALVEWTKATADYPGVVPVVVDVRPYADAGAGETNQLAFAVATGVEYLRVLAEAGVEPAKSFDRIEFRIDAHDDQFSTICKMRALRRMWARVGEVLEVPEEIRGARQHAVTSWRMLSRDDPYVNMLRATMTCFASAAGGADSVTVLPFDSVQGLPDAFSRRIARNTQVILAEESHLGRVIDPGGGSYYVEALTDDFAEAAWTVFQEIEKAGGFRQALVSGDIAKRAAADREELDKRLADRSSPLTGVSMFPNLDETPLPRTARTTLPALSGEVTALPRRRNAEIYEKLRDRAQAGADATAVLVGVGTRRDFGGREGFAAPLLNAGGIRTKLVEVTSADQVAAALANNPAKVAVVCSSPKVNGELSGSVIKALREAGVANIYLAGNPKELGDDAGAIDGNVAVGVNAVEILTTMLDQLGVPQTADNTQGEGA
ncbi:MAG: methylmalonyl-CoA mutase family protein [Dermatophilus congolensis]|nr:methylmalonyl-CoA mutase family protein [Dermatophilus congolensis]